MRKVVVAQVGIGLAVVVLALVYFIDPAPPAVDPSTIPPLPGSPPPEQALAPPDAPPELPSAGVPPPDPPPEAGKLPPGEVREGPDPSRLPPEALKDRDEGRTGLPPEYVASHPPPATDRPPMTPDELREAIRSGEVGPNPDALRPSQIEGHESGDLHLRPGQRPPPPLDAPEAE